MTDSPLKRIREKRKLTLRDLYFMLHEEIKLSRLSDINVCRKMIEKEEIEIFKKYLNLSEEEIKSLENMEVDNVLLEADKFFKMFLSLVPDDLKAGEEVIKQCPRCGSNLKISRAKNNGHLWIVCEKEGVLMCS